LTHGGSQIARAIYVKIFMVKNMRVAERLMEKIYKAVNEIEIKNVGVAFSGGIDSSLLVKVCKDVGKKITLLTVGFSSQRDINISNRISKALDLSIFHRVIPLKELDHSLKIVLSKIEFDRITRLENCVCFYQVFKLASEHGVGTVLSANGMDELFCGYDVYRRHFTTSQIEMIDLMSSLVKVAIKDKEEIDKLGDLFSIEYLCPFLSDSFVDFAMKIPMQLKIKSEEDNVRKHILREIALNVGVPRSAALRPKKAFQYSSGIHRAIRKLAKNKGFTRLKAKNVGYSSEIEAYTENLKKEHK
jgi:asparagine synthase (glutamine-hydrolysing)